MVFNVIAGFIIPCMLGVYLYFKDKKTLLTMAPIGMAFALLYNSIGFHVPFWKLEPFSQGRMALIPFDLGAYPVFVSYLIYFIKNYNVKNYKVILIFTLITTIIEYLILLAGRVEYFNGWNIVWTFISYLIPYVGCYIYYLILQKKML